MPKGNNDGKRVSYLEKREEYVAIRLYDFLKKIVHSFTHIQLYFRLSLLMKFCRMAIC